MLAVRARVVDTKTNEVIGEPSAMTKPGEDAVLRIGRNDGKAEREWTIIVKSKPDASGTIALVVRQDGRELQNTVTEFRTPGAAPPERKYSGEPITLNLSKAELKDVLGVFGRVTGLKIVLAPGIEGTVNANFIDVPWDQALEQILNEHNLAYRIEGNRMEVFRR